MFESKARTSLDGNSLSPVLDIGPWGACFGLLDVGLAENAPGKFSFEFSSDGVSFFRPYPDLQLFAGEENQRTQDTLWFDLGDVERYMRIHYRHDPETPNAVHNTALTVFLSRPNSSRVGAFQPRVHYAPHNADARHSAITDHGQNQNQGGFGSA